MISLSLDIEDIGEGVNKKKLRPHRELELSCTWSRQTAAVGIICTAEHLDAWRYNSWHVTVNTYALVYNDEHIHMLGLRKPSI